MSLIRLRDVGLIRDGKWLLRNIHWEIQPGEDWVLFGKNGSGKSLLLRIIEGYLHPSEGSVERFGIEHGLDLRDMRKRTGFIGDFIKRNIRGHSDIVDTVLSGKYASVGLYSETSGADKERALELIELMGCRYLIGRQYGSLSDGEKERVLIARSLMADPEILILDEPCQGLDIPGREAFLESLALLKRKRPKLSILFVTHHSDEIHPVFERILILKAGRVFRQGLIKDTLNSEVLSEALDIRLKVFEEYGRYWAIVDGKK